MKCMHCDGPMKMKAACVCEACMRANLPDNLKELLTGNPGALAQPAEARDSKSRQSQFESGGRHV